MAPKRILLLSNPRSGSTLLANYLKSHPSIQIAHELLNEEEDIPPEYDSVLDYVDNKLVELAEKHPDASVVGFKVFPEQIYERGLAFDQLVLHLGITHVVVLWRANLLETFVSIEIANATGEWYSIEEPGKVYSAHVDSSKFEQYKQTLLDEWSIVGRQWPVHVYPIYVNYDELVADTPATCDRILYHLSCSQIGYKLYAFCKRQNPAPLHEKVTNWTELQQSNAGVIAATFNAQSILEPLLEANLKIPRELLQFVPDREPPPPVGGWTYRVAEPYISKQIKQNVYEAMESGIVSSAGCWTQQMSQRLKALFGVPVAQPCSNGFTSIVLALQAAGLKPGDEVVVPSMTMIAVANAVSYTGARPVFADSAADNYNPSWAQIEAVATNKTKAVIVTHTYGVPTPDMPIIAQHCKERGWWLVEDISECVGIKILTHEGEKGQQERLLGTFGDFACASLYANKIVHGGDGGFVIARNSVHGEQLKSLANHGFTPSYHFVHFDIAMNAKINGVGAAMAVGCLDELPYIMKHRAELAQDYRSLLCNNIEPNALRLMPECGHGDTPWVFGVECGSKAERTALRAWLARFGVETRDFFFPLHLQPAYNQNRDLGNSADWPRLPNSERFGSTCFYLPTYTNLKRDDIAYICTVIQKYFEKPSSCGASISKSDDGNDSGNQQLFAVESPTKPPIQSFFIDSDTFDIGVRTFNAATDQFQPDENWGKIHARGHPYKRAIKLLLELEEVLVLESWAKQQMLMQDIHELIDITTNSHMKAKITGLFQKYVEYFESQAKYEDLQHKQRPWTAEDLDDPIYKSVANIPTTTDPETLQLLVWLVKQRSAATVWEIGAWFGHATARFAAAAKLGHENPKVYACDVFQWQNWMKRYLTKTKVNALISGSSFLPHFESNVAEFKDRIQPVIWPYTISHLPAELAISSAPDLVFIDLTQDEAELEFVWSLIRPKLVSRKTVIVINGFVSKSLPFFTRNARSLVPIAKPNTIAKSFLYVDENEAHCEPAVNEPLSKTLDRKLRFSSSPSWTHHHRNAFGHSIELLKEELHSPTAATIFVPAIEETLCDEPEILVGQPWIGIIHSVLSHPEYFYTPDLTRLCSEEFRATMSNCRGLFTLTAFQADFLRDNLKKALGYSIPIQSLTYPMITDHIPAATQSTVLQNWKSGSKINFLLIGSFARDFDLFYNCKVPSNLLKTVLVGDETIQAEVDRRHVQNQEQGIQLLPRLDEAEYEAMLQESIVFLPLKYDGAANTAILECIARNIPIVVPSLKSCTEYIGEEYPLIYQHGMGEVDFSELVTLDRVHAAVEYLKAMDKSRFEPSHFIETVKSSAVLLAVGPDSEQQAPVGPETKFDVTISICSYKRTHHLPAILDSLWNQQDFTGTVQIIVWNNNSERSEIVHHACKRYVHASSRSKSLEIIESTTNYYCTVRLALAHLMKGSALLICDDDIIPNRNFISFFMTTHAKYPTNVLCTRGHIFLPHPLDMTNPTNVWGGYEHLRFKSDEAPEQFIHFVHADTCLIPKAALLEACSVELPDPTFALVDDYWMSFILNSKFGRRLRKLTTKGLKQLPFTRTEDGDTVGLALHTRPEVKDAKLRLYIHHKLQNWPPEEQEDTEYLWNSDFVEKKKSFWKSHATKPFIGYNVSSRLTGVDIEELVKLGVRVVRIGAVGMGGGNGVPGFPYEFDQLNDDPYAQVEKLATIVELLKEAGIYVVVTTSKRLASPLNWSIIAKGLRKYENVIGYDLINEPFISKELGMHRSELENIQPNGIPKEMMAYMDLINAVREFDSATPIVIEPSFWGHLDALRLLPIQAFLKHDENLVASFHFYEPRLITQRTKNGGRYQFPGDVPIFDNVKYPDTIHWDAVEIKSQLSRACEWAKQQNVTVFLGEFGICRDVGGSDKYLEAIVSACHELGLSGFVYSFRDKYWDAMNYELGTDPANYFYVNDNGNGPETGNKLMKVLKEGIHRGNGKNE